ncbi:MAG: mannose-6-phosphate isomerase [Sphingopyxis sp.]|nr:mannose-6-phosphate isomerase [Sphingopyxis sp.]
MAARLLGMRQVTKPWGRAVLPAPFMNEGSEPVGEIWFAEEGATPLPLLAKYLFTSQKLSIQVHPNNAQARERGEPSGKEECWLVLDAEPGAVLGIGTTVPLSGDELRAASLDGSIEDLMDWKSVERGDFFYIPAGTVHAIGAGVSLIEVQQHADITYRLYDYGRPRELHLDHGVAVSDARPYVDSRACHVDFAEDRMLVDGPLFRVAIGGVDTVLAGSGATLVVPLSGTVAANGGMAKAGDCLAVDPGGAWQASEDARLLVARMVQDTA